MCCTPNPIFRRFKKNEINSIQVEVKVQKYVEKLCIYGFVGEKMNIDE